MFRYDLIFGTPGFRATDARRDRDQTFPEGKILHENPRSPRLPRIFVRLGVLCVFGFTLIAETSLVYGQSTLIPLTTHRAMVFDHAGKYLYISTSDGYVQRYNLTTKQIDNSYQLGGSLNGIDVAPDDSFLLVAQDNLTSGEGTFQRVNLGNGTITNINYTPDTQEIGGWDVAICSNGLAFVTTQFDGSGFIRVRQIDLSTNTLSVRSDVPGEFGGYVTQNTRIHRSADGTHLYFLEPNISNGPLFTYNASTNTFGTSVQTPRYLDTTGAAISRDGSLLATILEGYASLDTAPDFGLITSFNGLDSGLAFDPNKNVLYGVNSSTAQIVAYDIDSLGELYRLNIAEQAVPYVDPFNQGDLAASPDGHYLALETAAGIRLFELPQTSPSPTPTPSPSFTGIRDLVFSRNGNYLYIGSQNGLVWPYNLTTSTLETPYNVRGSLNGIDIASDDSFLLIAQAYVGLTEAAVEKLDLNTGTVSHIIYPLVVSEDGSWAVSIASNGLAFLSTQLPPLWSGELPLRQINLADNAVSIRLQAVAASTTIHRSADRTRLLFLEPDNDSGPMFSYSATSDAFGPTLNTNNFLDHISGAVSRDGSLAATTYGDNAVLYTLPSFAAFSSVSGPHAGVAFDAVADTFYATDTTQNQIVAYDINTSVEKFRIDIGEQMPGAITQFDVGSLVPSQDGHYLAVHAPSAIRVVDVQTQSQRILPISTPPPIPTPTPNTYTILTGSFPYDGGSVSGAGTYTAGSTGDLDRESGKRLAFRELERRCLGFFESADIHPRFRQKHPRKFRTKLANPYPVTNSKTVSYAYSDTESDPKTHAHTDRNSEPNGHTNSDAHSNDHSGLCPGRNGQSGSGINVCFFSSYFPMDCRQCDSICSDTR